MNWSRLVEIPCWTPLDQTGLATLHIKDTLYQVEAHCYLIAVPHDERYQTVDDKQFVTLLIWAQSRGAALRAALMEIESDAIFAGVTPPPEMLLPNAPNTYGETITALKSGKYGTYSEHASYRIARDGAFIHRAVCTRKFEFYFRGLQEEKNECPYAILRRL